MKRHVILSDKNLGMKWFRFYVDFLLVLGCFSVVLMLIATIISVFRGTNELYGSSLAFWLVYQAVGVILYIPTCVFMKKRILIGYYLNIVLLAFLLVVLCLNQLNYSGYFVTIPIYTAFYILNFLYFKKRRPLFNGK